MKIKSIKISNILSFEYKDKIDDCQEIRFDENLNILIGPNGAGKSNFLEILNQVFRNALFYDCVYDEDMIRSYKENPIGKSLQNTIQHQQRNHSLTNNYESKISSKQIKIEIGLSNNDKSNLLFIHQNKEKISELSHKYTNKPITFPTTVTADDLTNTNSIVLVFEDLNNQGILVNNKPITDNGMHFITLYLQYFNYIQKLIIVANKEESENWEPLKNSFALISSYRNYNQITSDFQIEYNENNSLNTIKANMINENMRSSTNNEPAIFSYVKNRIGYAYHKLMRKTAITEDKDPIEDFVNPIFLNINKMLHDTLGLKLYVKNKHENLLSYPLSFIDEKTGRTIQVSDLSAGEKGIIHFIFSIYGHDVENGVMIIDEPEIHLHPQIQQKYLNIISEAIELMHLQFIIATHSPIFVNSKTIESIHRFYKQDDKFTRIVNPNVTTDEKDLIQILTYTNSSKIFFSNRVVLVEGDSDEYFFRFFYDQYKIKKKRDLDVEFLYIGGKGRYPLWKDFLSKYEIKTYYIGDLDNIFDNTFPIVDDALMNPLKTSFEGLPDTITKMNTNEKYRKGNKLYNKDLLGFIRSIKPSEWEIIKSRIVSQYANNTFILQEGELEDYLDSRSKLEGVIRFCKNRFHDWYDDKVNKTKTDELDKIFDLITA